MRNTLLLLLNASMLCACAALDPNPNIGMKTVDLMYQNGNCAGALKLAEQHAADGEPWAQFRFGAILADKKCEDPNLNKIDSHKNYEKAIGLIKKAACYDSKTPWERGDSFSSGPTGFFNSRGSSAKASIYLSQLYSGARQPWTAWYYIDHVISQYSPKDDAYDELSRIRSDLEKNISPELLMKLHENNPKFCSSISS